MGSASAWAGSSLGLRYIPWGGGSIRMVSVGARWHGHGTGANLGWPVEVDTGTHLRWWRHIEKGQGVSKCVGMHGNMLGCMETCWDALKHVGMHGNMLGCIETCWDALKHVGMH